VDFPIIYYEGATLTERDGYEHGVPCWVDTWQEDPDTAATFYAGVFGWEVEKGTPPGTDTRYYVCRLRGSDVAAIGSPRTPECRPRGSHTCGSTTPTRSPRAR
jgi:predicted enzyme related to lactoylglutathione lyase